MPDKKLLTQKHKSNWASGMQIQDANLATCKVSMMTPEQLAEYQAKTENTKRDVKSVWRVP